MITRYTSNANNKRGRVIVREYEVVQGSNVGFWLGFVLLLAALVGVVGMLVTL